MVQVPFLNKISQDRLWSEYALHNGYFCPDEGSIEVGNDADLVLVDMNLKKKVKNGQLKTKVNWSPFHGMELQGWPVRTIVNGQTVFLNGEVNKNVRGKEIIFAS